MKVVRTNIQFMDCECLNSNERPFFVDEFRWKKMQSIKEKNDKMRSLASAYLLNTMCEKIGINSPEYGCKEKGKPYLKGHEEIAFNISHSGDYAVLVYNMQGVNGIDIQQIRTLKEGMKKRILNQNEVVPDGFTIEEENVYLNRIWCIKESYVKMTGEGLALDFRRIQIDFLEHQILEDGIVKGYFKEDMSLPGYVMAVCNAEAFDMEVTDI